MFSFSYVILLPTKLPTSLIDSVRTRQSLFSLFIVFRENARKGANWRSLPSSRFCFSVWIPADIWKQFFCTQWRQEKPGDSLQKGASPFAAGTSTKAQRGLFASFDGTKQRACRRPEVCHQAARGQQQPERWPWNGRSWETHKALTYKNWCPGRIFPPCICCGFDHGVIKLVPLPHILDSCRIIQIHRAPCVYCTCSLNYLVIMLSHWVVLFCFCFPILFILH